MDPAAQILTLSKKLMSLASTADNAVSRNKILLLSQNELAGQFPVETFTKNGMQSLLVRNKIQSKHFHIILNCHLDVVPGKNKQFAPYIKNGKLYARGAYDMKAAAAVMLLLFKHIAHDISYPLALQIVTDEETGGYNGTKYQIDSGITSNFVIAGENTDLTINNEAKGVLWAVLAAKGKAAHAGYPWLGDNALLKLGRGISNLITTYPIPKKASWQTTINIAKIETTNTAFNKVPDEAFALVDIRYIQKDKDTIVQNVKDLLPVGVMLTVKILDSPQYTPQDNIFIKNLQKHIREVTGNKAHMSATHGVSDVRFYEAVGVPSVCFGPIGKGPHSDEEWVDIKSLTHYYYILKQFLLSQTLA